MPERVAEEEERIVEGGFHGGLERGKKDKEEGNAVFRTEVFKHMMAMSRGMRREKRDGSNSLFVGILFPQSTRSLWPL